MVGKVLASVMPFEVVTRALGGVAVLTRVTGMTLVGVLGGVGGSSSSGSHTNSWSAASYSC